MENNKIYFMPQYGLGSWLQENAGAIGSIAGAGIGSIIPGAGTAIGAMIGGQIGGMVQSGYTNNQNKLQADRNNDIASAVNSYASKPNYLYGANFANGGVINSFACGGGLYGCGGKMSDGGIIDSTKYIDNVTVYGNGGTHEQNPAGGIKVGDHGLVEQGEVRYGNYIFSNRF